MPGDDNGSASVSPVDDGKFTAVNSAAQAPEAPTGAPGQGVVFGGAQVGTPKDDWEEKTDNGKRKRSDSLEGERPEITAARIVAAQDSLASAEGEHQTPVNQRTVIEGSIYSDRDRYDEDTNMADAAGGHGAESSPQPPGSAPRRKRQFTNRTKTGCITCRKRKKKCDEGKPECECWIPFDGLPLPPYAVARAVSLSAPHACPRHRSFLSLSRYHHPSTLSRPPPFAPRTRRSPAAAAKPALCSASPLPYARMPSVAVAA